MERLRNFVESQQLTRELTEELFRDADIFAEQVRKDQKITPILDGKIVVMLFYEPSTRTRFSFESATQRLGGDILSSENAKDFSSAVKGETIEDTIRIVEKYGHAVVIRHQEQGSVARAAALTSKPVINAGDGVGQHPTQALLDIYTIMKEVGKLDGIRIAMVGDLTHGRTVRSLAYLLGKYDNVHITFVSLPGLGIGGDIKDYLERHSVEFEEVTKLAPVIPNVDVLYMTRMQKERMNQEEFEKGNGKYVIDFEKFNMLRPSARLMHPLPRVGEISLPVEVEQNDPRFACFRQAENGVYTRMALLKHLLLS